MTTLLFAVDPQRGVPIYRQLVDQVIHLVAAGQLAPGSLLPSVRELAASLRVNAMTVSKAWAELARLGVVESERGTGMRVAALRESAAARLRRLDPLLDQVADAARRLDLAPAAVADRLRSRLERPGNP